MTRPPAQLLHTKKETDRAGAILATGDSSRSDFADACAVAWTAARRAAGLSRSLPDPPEVFSDGVPAAIHV